MMTCYYPPELIALLQEEDRLDAVLSQVYPSHIDLRGHSTDVERTEVFRRLAEGKERSLTRLEDHKEAIVTRNVALLRKKLPSFLSHNRVDHEDGRVTRLWFKNVEEAVMYRLAS